MRKPIIMNDGDTKPAGMVFEFCHHCKTALFVPQKSKIQLLFVNLFVDIQCIIDLIVSPKKYHEGIKHHLKHGSKIINSYVCPVCHDRHIICSSPE